MCVCVHIRPHLPCTRVFIHVDIPLQTRDGRTYLSTCVGVRRWWSHKVYCFNHDIWYFLVPLRTSEKSNANGTSAQLRCHYDVHHSDPGLKLELERQAL